MNYCNKRNQPQGAMLTEQKLVNKDLNFLTFNILYQMCFRIFQSQIKT